MPAHRDALVELKELGQPDWGLSLAWGHQLELGERLLSRDWVGHVERGEIAFPRKRSFEELMILPSRDFDRAEGSQMICHELGIQELETARLQPGDEMDQCHL